MAEEIRALQQAFQADAKGVPGQVASADFDALIRGKTASQPGQSQPGAPPPPPPPTRAPPDHLAGTEPSGVEAASTTPARPANPAPIERYPNIEAPGSVAPGQEFAVQVSLTSDQIAPETRIVSGKQNAGKIQLEMAEGERQWTLTVVLSVPGIEFTRGGSNTAEITIDRDNDSSIAAFYLRAQPLDQTASGRRETRIFATLWHNGAFLARVARPLAIVDPGAMDANRTMAQAAAPAPVSASAPAPRPMAAARQAVSAPVARPAVSLDETLKGPDITIVENRMGNLLRIDFNASGAGTGWVPADIADPNDLHNWIDAHFARISSLGRGFGSHANTTRTDSTEQHAADVLNAFGAELYDRYAPPIFKKILFDVVAKNPGGRPITIQVLSDDPAIPWELMRPALPVSEQGGGTNGRMDFLGVTCSIARWPLSHSGSSRPPQAMAVARSVVVAPTHLWRHTDPDSSRPGTRHA